ncbi:MAG: diaminopimelate epimerase [Desulfohalobiaceae bacterium]|nr:diaminopimelate epimerase [Desulfohalobiaceae bacterium]
MSSNRMTIPFYKMQGSGNDFILVDNNRLKIERQAMDDWARKLCARSFGIGADGLIFLESPPAESEADYCWHFYNSDGSRAEMCGNGSRCAARLAYELGLAPAGHIIGTDAGAIKAEVDPAGKEVKVQLTKPRDLKLDIPISLDSGRKITVHFVNTGVPHVVYFSPRAFTENLEEMGPAIRYHPRFAPAGANVNCVEIRKDESIFLRTYERGVEDETLACGTGAAAAAVIANALGHCGQKVPVVTTSREHLEISLEKDDVFLRGQAILVYTGELNPEAVGL